MKVRDILLDREIDEGIAMMNKPEFGCLLKVSISGKSQSLLTIAPASRKKTILTD